MTKNKNIMTTEQVNTYKMTEGELSIVILALQTLQEQLESCVSHGLSLEDVVLNEERIDEVYGLIKSLREQELV